MCVRVCVCVCVCMCVCTFKDHGLFPFQNLQVMTFKSSCHFSSVWVKTAKKVLHTCPRAFDHFADHLLVLC